MKFFLTSMFGRETSRGDRRFGLDRIVFLLSLFILIVTVLMPMLMIVVRTNSECSKAMSAGPRVLVA